MINRIKQLMESQHMTQQTFADFIGISSASLSSIFNGRTKPTLNTVEAIKSKYPKISLDWLMYGTGTMFNDQKENTDAPMDMSVPFEGKNLFGDIEAAPLPFQGSERTNAHGVANTTNNMHRTEIKYIDKPKRNITEIRIFFDDQTWETFLPKK